MLEINKHNRKGNNEFISTITIEILGLKQKNLKDYCNFNLLRKSKIIDLSIRVSLNIIIVI